MHKHFLQQQIRAERNSLSDFYIAVSQFKANSRVMQIVKNFASTLLDSLWLSPVYTSKVLTLLKCPNANKFAPPLCQLIQKITGLKQDKSEQSSQQLSECSQLGKFQQQQLRLNIFYILFCLYSYIRKISF